MSHLLRLQQEATEHNARIHAEESSQHSTSALFCLKDNNTGLIRFWKRSCVKSSRGGVGSEGDGGGGAAVRPLLPAAAAAALSTVGSSLAHSEEASTLFDEVVSSIPLAGTAQPSSASDRASLLPCIYEDSTCFLTYVSQ